MSKVRSVSVLAAGAVVALAIGGTALAASADDSAVSPETGVRVSASPSASAGSGSAGIGVAAAREIAVRAAGGGRVTSVEAETEHGRAVWDVDVLFRGVEHDIDVDRGTGAVLRHRIGSGGAAVARVSKAPAADDRGGDRDRGGDDPAGDDHGGDRGDGGGHGSDDLAGDDRGGDGAGSDDSSTHDIDDDRGGDRGGNGSDDEGDDRGGDDHGGHGSDD